MVVMAAEPADPGTPRAHLRWWHRGPFARRDVRLSVGTVLVFLFVFYVALPLAASHRAEVNTLAHINIAYLALGVLLEVGALAAYAQLTHAVLPADGPKRFHLFRINLSTLALSHVSPGGNAPGAALGYRLLTQSGVSGSDAGFALGTQGIGSAVVLNVIFWMSLVAFLVTHGFHIPAGRGGQESGSILVIVAAAIGVILLGAFGGLFYLLTRGQERASRVIRRVAGRIRFLDADRTTALVERLAAKFAALMEDRALTRRAVGWAAANWLLDAASLWVFVAAFSHFISPVDLLMAYGLANILAAIPITPGGLGVVEFVLVSMITGFGPTAGEALSGVLAFRAVNFWLPIPFGGLAYASIEFEKRSTYSKLRSFLSHRVGWPRRAGGTGADWARRNGHPSAFSGVVSSKLAATGAVSPSGSSNSSGSSRSRRRSTSPARTPVPSNEPRRAPSVRPSTPVSVSPFAPNERPGSHRSGAGGIPAPAFGRDPGG
jgi:putative heme transporter